MDGRSCVIDGEPVALRLAARMENTLQAFAIRAACFIGEQDVAFSEEFDGHDHAATHLIAYLGDEPIGTVRPRWFKSFAMPDQLAVIPHFRGHGVGSLLLEQARAIAEGRGSRRLEGAPGANATVALVHPTASVQVSIALDADDLSAQYAGDTIVTSPVASIR